MKQGLILLFVILLASACSNEDKYVITGHIEGAEDQTLYLQRMEMNQTVTIDSVKLKNGDFKFKNERLTEPTFFKLTLTNSNYITLLVDSIETVMIEAKAKNLEDSYHIQNSIGSAYIKILNNKIKKLNNKLNSLIAQYKTLGNGDKEKKAKLEKEYTEVLEEHKEFAGKFIMDNLQESEAPSFAGYYALFQNLDNNSPVFNVMDKKDQMYFSALATKMQLFYPESERAKQLYNYVLGAKAQQQREKITNELAKHAETGYVDIEAPDVNGKNIKLSSLNGKTILLSFWASWDKASVAENKNLKKLYAKYRSKGFEIYQVSLDKSKVLWESAIKKHDLPWINVSDLRYTSSYPALLYNIKQIPANYIISPKGEIIGKNLFGSRLSEKLDEIL